ncbi:MAG TPA: RagB/SusD family nutrient uptake outer membrane protein [Chitinophaga sp.]
MKKICALLGITCLLLTACDKDILNKKPDDTIAQPSTINDYQQLLDGIEGGVISNAPGLFSYRSLGNYLCDQDIVTDHNYQTYFSSQNFITGVIKWDKQMFNSVTALREWDKQYEVVLHANLALEGIGAINQTPSNQLAWNAVAGMAYFMRGQMYYNLAQFWAAPYHAATAGTDQGIVLRKNSDPDVASVRSSVQETYDQIIHDFKAALPFLLNTTPNNTPLSKVRPSKAAAYGALARTYLAMGDSLNTFNYADSALQLYSTLMDYNTVTSFSNFNDEMIHAAVDMGGTVANIRGFFNIDSNFIKTYDDNDLRKTRFYVNSSYAGGWVFNGDYSGNLQFTGIAVDELYLMRAEASARMGHVQAAMDDLNTLLVKRFATGTFTLRTAINASDALTQVLTEREKELVGRGLRWTDLRRLNTDPRFAVTLSRTLQGVTYTLPPNDSRYTLQVPDYIIAAAHGSIEQTK